MNKTTGWLVMLLLLSACDAGESPVAVMTESPAGAGSELPTLFSSPAGTWMSWVESRGEQHVLLLAEWNQNAWSVPIEAARGSDWFVNWADTPSVSQLDNGTLAVHWLQRISDESPYAYGVRVSLSQDKGKSWSSPQWIHQDESASEHGFVTMIPQGDYFQVVWLDGRDMTAGSHDQHGAGSMTLRSARLSGGGEVSGEALLDSRTCDCCPTAAVVFEEALLVMYRDRSETEVRDISVVREENGAWTEPSVVHADQWEINGCPVNGPSAAVNGNAVLCAWFTAPGEQAIVRYAVSDNGGVTFKAPGRLNQEDPIGRVCVSDAGKGFLAIWMEADVENEEQSRIQTCFISADGLAGTPLTLAATSNARASGFPKLVRSGDSVLAAWTDVSGETPKVRTARIQL